MKVNHHLIVISTLIVFISCHPVKRAGFRNSLTASNVFLNSEQSKFNLLNIKNDSLFKAGFLFENSYQEVKSDINTQKQKIDSVANNVNYLLRKVNFRVAFEEEFYELRPKIKNTNKLVNSQTINWNNEYVRIEKRMLESDISGEKVKFKTILNNASEKQQQATENIKSIGYTKETMLQSGTISESISKNIDNRLSSYKNEIDSITIEIVNLKQRLDQPSDFSKNYTTIKAKVILIDSVVNQKAKYQQYVFKMMEDGLSKSERKLFNLAAFFGPGGYIIPEDKFVMAKDYFSPIIDSLLKFSNTYSQVFRTAQVVVNGYADGMKIAPGTSLYNKIKDYIKKENPLKEELNAGLSALRAEEISKFIDRLIKERAGEFTTINKITFELLEAGEGEKLPDPNIKNYKENDERRRIVLIYWSVLPD